MRIYLDGIGLLGPGLSGWDASRDVLLGKQPYLPEPIKVTAPPLLPAAERRRIGTPVKLALVVAHEALTAAGCDAGEIATVFSSSSGDGDNVHAIFETLASPEREVSPTRFHNSVHNASAGYWSLATQCRKPSTSLCAYDASFAAGLLEAATQATVTGDTVALIAYDHPYPEPLNSKRPISDGFAVAFVLSPLRTDRTHAVLDVSFVAEPTHATTVSPDNLELLRKGVPAARSLPLLTAAARKAMATMTLQYGENSHLLVKIAP